MRGRRSVVALACGVALFVGLVTVPSAPVAAYTTVVYNGRGPNAPRISVIGDSVASWHPVDEQLRAAVPLQLHLRRRVVPAHDPAVLPGP